MIRPMALLDGAVWLHHDREELAGVMVGGHDGVTQIADLRHPDQEDGISWLDLPCPHPGCVSVSTQPVSGGNLSDADTRRLQQIFVERLVFIGWHPDEALVYVSDLIASQDGPERNFLIDRPATVPEPEESTMPETPNTPEPLDLGAAIIAEIDTTLRARPTSGPSPATLELLEAYVAQRLLLDHRTASLNRIKTTLQAAAELRDGCGTPT